MTCLHCCICCKGGGTTNDIQIQCMIKKSPGSSLHPHSALATCTSIMKLTFLLGICFALFFVSECLQEEDFIEDEIEEELENNARHLFKKCKSDSQCETGECCFNFFGIFSKCKRLRREGESCVFGKFMCHHKCQKGLECRRSTGFFKTLKCFPTAPPPTEEPGSGDFDF